MPTNIIIKNTNPINQLKISQENLEVDPKTKQKTWKGGADTFIKSGEFTEVWVGGPRRISIQEVPT